MGCHGFCPKEQRELLVQTRFNWVCPSCHKRRSNNEADHHKHQWSERKRKLSQDSTLAKHDRKSRMQALFVHETYMAKLLEQHRQDVLDEIEAAECWTWHYAFVVFAVRNLKLESSDQPSVDEQAHKNVLHEGLCFLAKLRGKMQLDLALVMDATRGNGKPLEDKYIRGGYVD
ncbi:hypothetical protein CDD82_2277 [Ophiocordyceps australis]|uniref:Uncharacterized protein n=1 Tax=Ophiocordyceps australis TaxID=1399860 RepID=A0A2C5ZQD9_9HYPO|nr:hypothetical protein CDD82_2277 [Ophiocordyceps australis]